VLESLLIQNFQTHDKTRVDFAPGITCIVGPSDVGKSAVIRALRWVCDNTPGGDAFIRHGAKGCTVKLIADGRTIARRRSPGGEINEYHLDDQEFKAFGRGVPEPVSRHLNLGAVSWQGQHDTPYWFGETAGEVSRQLNAIVNLGVIDDCLAAVASTRNKARTRLDVAEENLTAANKAHKALGWVSDFCNALDAVEDAEDAATRARAGATLARDLCAEAVKAQLTRDKAAGVAANGVNMVNRREVAVFARQRADDCAELVARAEKYKRDAAVTVPDMTALDEAFSRKKGTAWDCADFKKILADAKRLEAELCQAEKELKSWLAELPATCPVCGK